MAFNMFWIMEHFHKIGDIYIDLLPVCRICNKDAIVVFGGYDRINTKATKQQRYIVKRKRLVQP